MKQTFGFQYNYDFGFLKPDVSLFNFFDLNLGSISLPFDFLLVLSNEVFRLAPVSEVLVPLENSCRGGASVSEMLVPLEIVAGGISVS